MAKKRGAIPKPPKGKKKPCEFCKNERLVIDYKDINLLHKFLSDRGKILGRRITGNCGKHQRLLTQAIKRARFLGLLPYMIR